MSVGAALSLLTVIWCIIHLTHYISNRQDAPLLPTQSRGRAPFNKPRHTQTSLKALKFQVSTTRWNAYHDRLGSFLARRGNQNIAAAVRWFYNAGTVLGALGMLIAVLVLSCKCVGAGWTLLQKMGLRSALSDPAVQTLLRRRASFEAGATQRPGASLPDILPIIPGVTVPLSHLPVIIAAVFFSQAVHELGHALAATLEFLPMTACGASFIGCIPAAFVSFPDAGMKSLAPQARSRIVAAGPFHNLVFWVCLVLATRLGIANVVSFFSGYQNISDIGNIVVQVNPDSPLSLHFRSGSIITKLDDTSLSSSNSSLDMWSEYLQGKSKSPSLGWCVARTVFAKSDECCVKSAKPSPFSCFVTEDHLDRGCIDPVPVLTLLHDRCGSAGECPAESLCVIPREDSQLLRLTISPSLSQLDEQTIVLWSGPSAEIWEEVQVSRWSPRIWILPLWLPPLLSTFWEYLTMATLSLYFFNLLPLPHLDGTELLSSLLDCAFDNEQGAISYDFTALEAGNGYDEDPRPRRRWKQRIMRYSPYAMAGIALCFIMLSILNIVY